MCSRLLQKFKILSLALLLSGCGGGGGTTTNTDNNDPPAANTGILFTNIDTPGQGTLVASDPDGDTLSYSIITNGNLGTAVITNINSGEYTYTPNPGVEGTDAFTFKANDGALDSNIAVVTVHIEFDDAPVANNNTYTLNEGAILNIGTAAGVLANDSDDEGQALAAALITNVTHGALTLNNNGSFVYAHDGSETTSDSFTYQANDGSQDSNTATVTLVINPVNDPPVAYNDQYSVNEGGSVGIGVPGVLANDTDVDTGFSNLTAVLASNAGHGVVFLNSDGSFIYLHNGTENFSDSFTYRVSDGTDASNTASVSISVTPVNDPPITVNDSAVTNEDTPATINVLGNDSDVDGTLDVSSVAITSLPAHGAAVVNSNGSVTYTPAMNYFGADIFSYTVNGNNGATSLPATVAVTINPVNDLPNVDAGPDQSVIENTTVNLSGTGSDAEGAVTYQWTQISGTLVTLSNINIPNPSFGAPDVTVNQTLSFRLTVTDDDGAQTSDTVNISVVNTIFSDSFDNGNVNGWIPPVDETVTASSWEVINDPLTSNNYLQQSVRVQTADAYEQSYHHGTYSYWPSGTTLTNYRFSVDATFLGTKLADDIGVMFRYTDSNNYYRLSFNSRQGYTRLEKRVNGTFSTLATNSRGYRQDETLNISVNLDGSRIQIFLNDDPLFAVSDTTLTMGSVALYCEDKTQFDNVLILSTDTTPGIVLSTPIAYSVSTVNAIDAAAIVTNMPVGGSVQFLLDGTTSSIDGTSPYTALFTVLGQGNHTVEAILRNSSGIEIDRDTNVMAGTQGQFYIAYGDSIVNGSGDKYASDNILQDGMIISFQGYASVLTKVMNSTLGYPNLIVNEGLGGEKSEDAPSRIGSILSRHPNANKVLIMLGTNDSGILIPSGLGCSGSACDGTYKGNMQSLINTITAAGKQVWVALVPPAYSNTNGVPFTNPATATRNTTYIQGYNQVITSQLTNRSIGPDFYAYFLGAGTNRYSLFIDTLHPNSLGHVVMAYMWYNAMNPVDLPLPFILNSLTPSTTSPWLKQNLIETGNNYYVDETFTVTSAIPSALNNGRWVMTANAGKTNTSSNYVSFSVDRPVTVYVAYDAAATALPTWMSSYNSTSMTLETTDPLTPELRLYSMDFNAGSITLGGNRQGGATGASNYIAIVVEN